MFTIAGGILLALAALYLWPVTLGLLGGFLTFWVVTILLSLMGLSDAALVGGLLAAVAVGIAIPVKIYKALYG
jgi:hypothetical protein